MKFYAYSLVLPIALFTQVFAAPKPQAVIHCNSIFNPVPCPTGFKCCGPISVTLGGTCFPDGKICPL
ncbi:hypothetical protein K443DRAFT_682976 [Laccaria amethystina LaAM-08-1]|uniref:Long chronological lifespan protein 2 n=1 Tax=Laccaria amethystina LaAM-08-1 TaxID=1095629 RepID=A0A0C9XHE5_9AGAR|nr:hypothetical protein K443DRAFT_682976 [Laccaria amethystina LaAM-08-1]